jgi:hypothetical protein
MNKTCIESLPRQDENNQKKSINTSQSSSNAESVFNSLFEEIKCNAEESILPQPDIYIVEQELPTLSALPAEMLAHPQNFAIQEKSVLSGSENSSLGTSEIQQSCIKQADLSAEPKILTPSFQNNFEQLTQFSISFPQSWLSSTHLIFDRTGSDWRLKIKSSSAGVVDQLSQHIDELSHQFSTNGLGQLLLSNPSPPIANKPLHSPRSDSS